MNKGSGNHFIKKQQFKYTLNNLQKNECPLILAKNGQKVLKWSKKSEHSKLMWTKFYYKSMPLSGGHSIPLGHNLCILFYAFVN